MPPRPAHAAPPECPDSARRRPSRAGAATLARMAERVGDGLPRQALAALNGFGPYRFSAVYAFDGDLLVNRLLFDRENPADDGGGTAPVASTYCAFIRTLDAPFELWDSLVDDRVHGHAKKAVVRAYLGVPVRDADGRCIGTLCCFDFCAVAPPRSLRTAMDEAASLFAPMLQGASATVEPG